MHACALSIDVEDWYHAELVRRRRPTASPRVVDATRPILELLDRHRRRATFFVVGDVARRHPALIEAIADRGHELGCHGMTHRPLWELGPDGLAAELAAFAALIRDVLGPGAHVTGYRAPSFSLDRTTTWAMPILARFGYRYDASVFPIRTPLYGVAGAPLEPHRLGDLVEVPPAVAEIAGIRIPIGGGAYLRALPGWVMRRLVARARRVRPVVIYVHPWETDAATPRVALPLLARAATYVGIATALRKLSALVAALPFVSIGEVVDAWEAR